MASGQACESLSLGLQVHPSSLRIRCGPGQTPARLTQPWLPVLLRVPRAECPGCAHLEQPGCRRCLGQGPGPQARGARFRHSLARVQPWRRRAPWLERLPPATRDLMLAAQVLGLEVATWARECCAAQSAGRLAGALKHRGRGNCEAGASARRPCFTEPWPALAQGSDPPGGADQGTQ